MYYTAVTLGIFAFILVLVKFKLPLWAGVLTGTVLGGLLYGMNPLQVSKTVSLATIQIRTVGLAIIVLLIVSLSKLMNTIGSLEKIVKLAGQILRRPAVLMAALPALIGLLPMPGGALFSAPMVKTAAKNTQTKDTEMSAINYWFRHIWEHWWPLYPGVMLAVTLTEIPLKKFIVMQMPLTLCMILSGILLYRKVHPDIHVKNPEASSQVKRKFLISISPIWILLLVWLPASFIAGICLADKSDSSLNLAVKRYLPLTLGLIVSIFSIVVFKKVKVFVLFGVFKEKSTWKLMLTVIAVMVFQYMLGQTGAAGKIAEELEAIKVPVVLVVAILPFIAGLVTGLAIGFVGTSFIIILPLVMSLPGEVSVTPYVALAYGFGHLGQMISPIHICHIVSNEYFKTNFIASYKRLWPTFVINVLLVTGYFILLKYIT